MQEQIAAAQQEQQRQAAAPDSAANDTAGRRASLGAATPRGDSTAAGNTMTLPNGQTVKLPAGVTEAQIRAIMQKRMSGQQPTPEEQRLIRSVFQGMQRGGGPGGARRQSATDAQFGGNYIVFVKRGGEPTPVPIRTGLTDLDYSEVVSGLQAGDSVLVLPSASLVESQQEAKERINNMTGGGGVPGMQQQQRR